MKLINGRLSARDYIDSEFNTGKASRAIESFNIQSGERVFIVVRKSGCEREGNLEDQLANLRQVVRSSPGKLVGSFVWVGSGWEPYWLNAAVAKARQRKATIVLAETTDRFVRNIYFHSKAAPQYQATDDQIDDLARRTKGMRLMTHLHPDATPSEVRGYHSSRGQRIKGRPGGRPTSRDGYKKRRRVHYKIPVIRLFKQGAGNREIGRQLDLPEKTVRDWRLRYQKYLGASFSSDQS